MGAKAGALKRHGPSAEGDESSEDEGQEPESLDARRQSKRAATADKMCCVCNSAIRLSPTKVCLGAATGEVCGAIMHETCASRKPHSSERAPRCKAHAEDAPQVAST